jgi:hypothetical protein
MHSTVASTLTRPSRALRVRVVPGCPCHQFLHLPPDVKAGEMKALNLTKPVYYMMVRRPELAGRGLQARLVCAHQQRTRDAAGC